MEWRSQRRAVIEKSTKKLKRLNDELFIEALFMSKSGNALTIKATRAAYLVP
ncbi:hypothetical protein FC34_GL001282 [Lacticaseibacillus brantae DSM 23927]|uniref:Uncharacterized protein n=1 Tax=Lacticaseibacillus brantae DSM 23927 TaxID=1423727 RepID=A0A0R2B5U0_9LACO|nr:hypothetical protein FC34_GL001282 [Lacticaseibacillus brantae DSM 23927]